MELAGSRARPLAGACALAVLSAAARLAPYFTIYLMVRAIILNWNDLGALDLPFLWGLAFAKMCIRDSRRSTRRWRPWSYRQPRLSSAAKLRRTPSP